MKRAPLPRGSRVDADRPVVEDEEVLDDGEAQAGPGRRLRPGRVDPVEALEDLLAGPGGDPDPAVDDVDEDAPLARRLSARTSTRATGGENLIALSTRFRKTCERRRAVAPDGEARRAPRPGPRRSGPSPRRLEVRRRRPRGAPPAAPPRLERHGPRSICERSVRSETRSCMSADWRSRISRKRASVVREHSSAAASVSTAARIARDRRPQLVGDVRHEAAAQLVGPFSAPSRPGRRRPRPAPRAARRAGPRGRPPPGSAPPRPGRPGRRTCRGDSPVGRDAPAAKSVRTPGSRTRSTRAPVGGTAGAEEAERRRVHVEDREGPVDDDETDRHLRRRRSAPGRAPSRSRPSGAFTRPAKRVSATKTSCPSSVPPGNGSGRRPSAARAIPSRTLSSSIRVAPADHEDEEGDEEAGAERGAREDGRNGASSASRLVSGTAIRT